MTLRRVLLLVTLLTAVTADVRAQDPALYRPPLTPPESLEPFLKYLEPGSDTFAAEREARALSVRLGELADRLRAHRAPDVADWLLAPDFRGGRLLPAIAPAVNLDAPLEVSRSAVAPQESPFAARAFGSEFERLVADLLEVTVAEFLITSIEVEPATGLVRTDVRYDIVGTGTTAWRLEHVGVWRMRWRSTPTGWRVVEWTSASHLTSRARRPIFTEITEAAMGGTDSFRRQLTTGLDAWMATLDSVLTRDSNGHHGVSVGDVDGDGLDDLYVAQPAGLPNRLYRARGDSTFEDMTERAGVGVLDDTAQSLLVDVDNDGDQDLVLSTGTRLLLLVNDGTGRFAPVADAFRFQRPLQGSLTSIAMGDYDRDGLLDLYVCVYSYFYGAGEDKAGTPMPYHDARNGPPGVLFRNDGRGRFVDATEASGLDVGNDRYHFAAAWADYDGDGWQDLLVANDFGAKNLYRNLGLRDGRVRFEDVAAQAGVLDHGAGMSATFLDYDNDGRLDIYTGNMWSDSGLRVTSSPAFMPDAPPDVRALYRRHARGNSLFRNRGDGRFDDTTLAARAEMGRWAWSSDALDFDSDGWEDLYVVNGMLTRPPALAERDSASPKRAVSGRAEAGDLEGYFWRQVVARSPLTRVKGTPYDDAWRAINQLLVHDSIASRQRNVLLRNDGHGGFDEVSGAAGLDLEQDGRSFAVLDIDRDGDPDLAVMAARQAPQLRLFRNDFEGRSSSLAIRLVGATSNRDAVGAVVRVQTDRFTRTKLVQAGSGFLSQHSKELIFGLGASRRVLTLTVHWPSGRTQTFDEVTPNTRLRLVEGGQLERSAFAAPGTSKPGPGTADATPSLPRGRRSAWLYEPFPAPDFSLPDLRGHMRSLSNLRGRPAAVLLFSSEGDPSRAAVDALSRGTDRLIEAGIGVLAIALDPPADLSRIQPLAGGPLPVVAATRELGLSLAILNRHVFMNRQPLRLPTLLLLDAAGRVVKIYWGRVDTALLEREAAGIEAPAAERLARGVPFAGTLHSPLPLRNYLPYGHELMNQGLDGPALAAFELAVQSNPNAFTHYRIGTLLTRSGETARARAAFERALALQPDLAEASNDLGALLAQGGDLPAAIERFRAALASDPEYPDALNNLGYALLLSGRDADARELYQKAVALQPDFPEALNNLGMLLGRSGELEEAERYFRDALARRGDYGEAANNLGLVLVARGQPDAAVSLLEAFLKRTPEFEGAYVTLAKIHLSAGRTREGLAALERLLQRNPTNSVALELVRQLKPH